MLEHAESIYSMEVLFFTAFAIQPGPIGFESLRRGTAHGWSAALHVELGSLLGDGVWAAIALLGVSIIFQNRAVTLLLSVFGCGLLLRFAWDAWQASGNEVEFNTTVSRSNHLAAGAMLSLSNPQNITAWLGMSGTIVGLGFLDPQLSHLLVFFAGFMIAQICWCFIFATVVEFGRRLLNQQLLRWINLGCACFLALLGFHLLLQTLQMAASI